jgi:hypothetical protein
MLQRAHDFADRLGGDVSIERGRVQLRMSEQHLDDSDIDFLLEQMGGEAVPQVCSETRLLICAIWAAA